MDSNMSLLDILTILSFVVGVENLDLNIQQSQQLDEHLSKQDEELLKVIIKQNEELLEQNKLLLAKLEANNDRSI